MTEEQRERYARHLILPEVGNEGQKKLLAGRVLVIGAGGLGSPAILYLAAGGVGTIGIADGDVVDLSNLQRQIIHRTENIGMAKVKSAADRVRELNPDVRVITYEEGVHAENIADMIETYDFIIDGTDNFAARFLINDACVLAEKPFCHAGIHTFYGQVLTYVPGEGPCYRCLFEEMPSDGGDDGSVSGVLGSLPGIVGSIQALEAQKYLLGAGELLTGKLLRIDGRTMQFRTVSIPEHSDVCRVCGSHADIRELKREEYEGNASGARRN